MRGNDNFMTFIDEVREITAPRREAKKALKKAQAQYVWEAVVKPEIMRAARRGYNCVYAPMDEDYNLENPNALENLWIHNFHEINLIAQKEGFQVDRDGTISWK